FVRALRGTGTFLYTTAMLALIIAVAGGLVLWEPLLLALDKDSTLTGRTDIWTLVVDAIAERPWLGYGYGVFWQPENPRAQLIWYVLDWQFTHAHNGWLETLLQLG